MCSNINIYRKLVVTILESAHSAFKYNRVAAFRASEQCQHATEIQYAQSLVDATVDEGLVKSLSVRVVCERRCALVGARSATTSVDAIQAFLGATVTSVGTSLASCILYTLLAFRRAATSSTTTALATARRGGVDAKHVVIVGRKVAATTITHFASIPEVVALAYHSNVTGHRVGGSGGTGTDHATTMVPSGAL